MFTLDLTNCSVSNTIAVYMEHNTDREIIDITLSDATSEKDDIAQKEYHSTLVLSNSDSTPLSVAKNDASIESSDKRKKKLLKILLTILFIVLMGAIIAYTAVSDFTGESVSGDRVAELIGQNAIYIWILFGLFGFTVLMETFKLFIMIQKTTGKYKFGTAFNCAALGRFYDYVTPLGSGGQPFQMYYLAKHGVASGPAGAIPIGTLFLTQFSFFVCAIISFSFGVNQEIVPLYIQIIAYFGAVFYIAVPLFLVVFSFIPKAGYRVIEWGVSILTKLRLCKNPEKWIKKGKNAIDNNKKNMAIIFKSKRILIVCTLLSLLYIIAQCSMPYFALLLFSDALKSANLTPSWALWFEVTRITFFIYCAITFIPTPGNSGAADGTFYGLFRAVLVSVAGASFTCMMVWRIFSFYMYLILGIIVLVSVKIVERKRKQKTVN